MINLYLLIYSRLKSKFNLDLILKQSVVEKVVYRVSEDNPEWTVAKRSAWIDSQVYGFSRAIQAFGLDRFRKNCAKMSSGFNYVLEHMFPHTAQCIKPVLGQMNFAERVSVLLKPFNYF